MDSGQNGGQQRVLLVDDDEPNRDAMGRALGRAGFDVVTASSGAEAVELAQRHRLDLLVLDVFLRDSGGLGVMTAVRALEHLRRVPVLFVTGLSSPAVRLTLAPEPVLVKPFARQALVAAARRAIHVA
jgi:CheY-like chemotaxis protein